MVKTTLDKLNNIVNTGKIIGIDDNLPCKSRLSELGFGDGCEVKYLRKAPSGDPVAYLVKDAVVALRCADANKIQISLNRGDINNHY